MSALCPERSAAAAETSRPPNFVFFLIDDLGYMDVGALNPETFYETPSVDRLAREGMTFTEAYTANPVCSPTRFSIMTGRYPTRVKATNYFSGKREGRFAPAPLNDWMPLEEITLGEALRDAGYRTAFVGKWHLGPDETFWPENQGFDFNIAGCNRGSPRGSYFSPYRNPRLTDGPPGEFLTERLTTEAVKLLDQLAGSPFLLYFSMYAVHTPLQAPSELVEKYQRKAEALPEIDEFATEEQIWETDQPRRVRVAQRHPVYAAMVESMDTSVGRILDRLDELGLRDNTVVVFFSDNGGLSTSEGAPTSNQPLRAGKGWLYEGGVRVPLIVRWPGTIGAGSRCDQPVISIDFLPTLLEVAQAPLPKREIDGVSFLPLLKGAQAAERRLYWHYPHYGNQGGFPGGAIRQGPYKLIERFEDGRVQLFDLSQDLGEQHDLADDLPETASQLRSSLHAWYRQTGAEFLRARQDGPQPWRPY